MGKQMDKMTSSVKVFDAEGQLLFECPVDEAEKAHSYAVEMEKMGVEVGLSSPSIPETLLVSLGARKDDLQSLGREIEGEIESHGS